MGVASLPLFPGCGWHFLFACTCNPSARAYLFSSSRREQGVNRRCLNDFLNALWPIQIGTVGWYRHCKCTVANRKNDGLYVGTQPLTAGCNRCCRLFYKGSGKGASVGERPTRMHFLAAIGEKPPARSFFPRHLRCSVMIARTVRP